MNSKNSKIIEVKNKLEAQRLLKVAAFDQNKIVTKPHKHNGYLEIVFLSSTNGKHSVDGRESIVKTPCLLIIRKDNVHHWELENPVKGYVVLLKKMFVDQSLDFELAKLIDELVEFDTIYLKDSIFFESLLSILEFEMNKTSQEGLLKALLAKALESTDHSKKSKTSQNSLYANFCELLNENPRVLNHVAYYASLLNTSPQNLNASCKKNTNLTASEVLAGYIIKEAKRLLFYTSNSISEIAFQLGFSDKSNFSKYFKRYSGVTPSEFKKNQH
ncbi:AraC family transcriptional regulator [Sphingobacterium sp. 1.A.5]|uniref:AraC family transcriptional regulator n=1 Tax=Sphingobacterium sp. 1.A.5 TaxID=2044604 RepID=UPI000C0BD317|nr:helix-turn-helix domain-containing protein [Sphingobacterium sp. 1.A.5]